MPCEHLKKRAKNYQACPSFQVSSPSAATPNTPPPPPPLKMTCTLKMGSSGRGVQCHSHHIALPVGVRVIKITHRDVSCHGEQSDHICKKYSDQMNFNEVYTRGGILLPQRRGGKVGASSSSYLPEDSKVHKLFPPPRPSSPLHP